MAYGVSNGHATDDVTCSKGAEVILATAWLLVKSKNNQMFKLV